MYPSFSCTLFQEFLSSYPLPLTYYTPSEFLFPLYQFPMHLLFCFQVTFPLFIVYPFYSLSFLASASSSPRISFTLRHSSINLFLFLSKYLSAHLSLFWACLGLFPLSILCAVLWLSPIIAEKKAVCAGTACLIREPRRLGNETDWPGPFVYRCEVVVLLFDRCNFASCGTYYAWIIMNMLAFVGDWRCFCTYVSATWLPLFFSKTEVLGKASICIL